MTYGPNEMAMRLDMAEQAAAITRAGGFENVSTFNDTPIPGAVIHEMGTARMGADPKQSVVNRFNQLHDAPNVFVTDGACMASTACQNPSLTYMALTARAADVRDRRARGRPAASSLGELAHELEAHRLADRDRSGRSRSACPSPASILKTAIVSLFWLPATRNAPVGSMLKARGALPPVGMCCSSVELAGRRIDGVDHQAVVAAVRAVEELAGRVQQHFRGAEALLRPPGPPAAC